MTFLLVEEFSAMCLISAIEALRSANYILKKKAYSWHLVSHDGKPVKASNGIEMAVEGAIGDRLETDYLFVTASFVYDPPYRARIHSALRQLDRAGVRLGAVSVGTFILARAGLLNNARCTIHWEYLPAFQEQFPEIDVVNELYVIDRGRYTSSGGLSSMEMMLQLVAEEHGPDVAVKCANNFQLDRLRNSTSSQRSGAISRLDTMPPAVQSAVELMLKNVEVPLSNADIADRIQTSVRNLERVFKRNMKASPAKFYLSLRLEKARELLMHTNLSTLDVALQTGFSSSSYFARCFQREFHMRPSDIRRNG